MNFHLRHLLFLILAPSFVFSQFSFGAKAGLNYDSLGSLSSELNSLTDLDASAQTGFHVGVYGQINVFTLYLRPEIQFSQTKSAFGESGTLEFNKIEMPLLAGYRFFPFLSVFAGPSFHYIFNQKASLFNLGEMKEQTTVGLQMGTRIQLGRLGLGIRFERGFTDNEITLLGNNNLDVTGRIDTRPKQWILSASYRLDFGRKRGSSDNN